MRIDVLTLFPEMCESVLSESIIGKARQAGLIRIYCHNIRDYTKDKHKRVDDAPYGGGMGMVMSAQPIYDCYKDVCGDKKLHLIYLSPQGKVFNQEKALELSKMERFVLLCGHYEGVDQRVLDEIVDEEISIGDYVLTGGELPALVVIDAVCRLVPGVLADSSCYEEESHYKGLLEYPQYTRPAEWMGKCVPEILLSGHHANIQDWRRKKSLEVTFKKRPDLLEKANLTPEDKIFLKKLKNDCE
ncbi:MAG TPA: tRNA (guanosine(37)-N1)-methyltransferase TrmD [Clostridiales bacterium]|nr:tRNA (guanosine(37)-N1)-methyltransferase TrmD [Clostridiales bacterium]